MFKDAEVLNGYYNEKHAISVTGESETIKIAKKELLNGLNGLLGKIIPILVKSNKVPMFC